MPQTVVEAATVKEFFFNIAGFPRGIGCVDGIHVAIQGPVVNEHEYVNRKGDYSINVQLLCNADLVIMDCVVRWPGSVHDAWIMRNSNLFRRMETTAPGARTGVVVACVHIHQRQRCVIPWICH
ncbi:hypothetical protein BaRGS_00032054 [Batillaria attramentaria]|uniref:DDE Tnp4 domain-containing protein n=1 Tax=Batillaria attramentaria TaxID=370345 RepID=A0ABD0JQF8_9CAEN